MAPSVSSSSTTSFVIVEPLDADTSPSSSSSQNEGRVVRFDTECVLIPEYHSSSSRRPRVVTKSYSLPLWKRRSAATQSDPDYTEDPGSSSLLSSSPEETHVVIRVPIPSFVRRSSRSPHSAPRSPSTSPLSPCLVQRSPFALSTTTDIIPRKTSSSSQSPTISTTTTTTTTNRRPPLPIYQRRPEDQTIPLRACCPDCVPITDQCIKQGSTWQEKFTKGANRRRRSASLDSPSTGIGGVNGGAGQNQNNKAGFVPSSFDARMPPPIAITVDEVEKRRRSLDLSTLGVAGSSTGEGTRSGSPPRSTIHRSTSATIPFRTTQYDRGDQYPHNHSAESSDDSHSSSLLVDAHPHDIAAVLPRKASPIAEEDENELFPLPSPRRSPTGSGSRSPASSASSCVGSPRHSRSLSPRTSPRQSPGQSPNASSSCLHPNSAAVLAVKLKAQAQALSKGKEKESEEKELLRVRSRSKESVSSEEVIKGDENTLSRREGGVGSGASTPRPGSVHKPSLTLSSIPIPSAERNNAGGDTVPNSPVSPVLQEFIPSSSFASSSSTGSSAKFPPTPTSYTTSPKLFSASSTTSPRLPFFSSPTLSSSSPKTGNNRKTSSSSTSSFKLLPFIKAGEVIKGASVDVLRGVSTISGGPIGR